MTSKLNQNLSTLAQAIIQIKNLSEAEAFLRDLLTPAEINELTKRLTIAKLLYSTDLSYQKIANKVKTSTTTVTRVSSWLNQQGQPGYKVVLKRLLSEK